jgi:hypothetical protein
MKKGRNGMTGRSCMRIAVILAVVATGSARPVASAPSEAKDFDLQGFIDRELKAGNRRIVVPPGRYRVTPKNAQHLVLRDLQDVQILADGVEMTCTETTRALTVASCRNVLVRGLVIDYDPLPFTQGRIVKMSEDKKVHEVELFDGYPPAEQARAFKYEIFRPDTRTLRCEDHYPQRVEAVDPKHLRVHCGGGSARDPEQVGDLVVIGSEYAPHGNAAHAVECSNNVNVRLETIDLYASNCFGFLEYGCDGSVYQKCRIDRRPAATDIVKRADPRLRSLDADAFHSKHAIKGPSYLSCVAKFMGDDCINICGDYHLVTECRGAELRVLAKHAMNIAAGDPVELFAYDGRRLQDAKAVRVEPDGKIRDPEREFIRKQRMDEGLRSRGCGDAFTVALDRAVDLPPGSLIASARRMGNGFLVQGCDFGFNRSRGILIKASDGKVLENRITESWMMAVLVSPEYWWLESGSSNNVEIRGNVITGCRGRPILVHAQGGEGLISGKAAPAGAHNNITIAGNTMTDCPMPAIEVTSTEGLKVENNTVVSPRGAKPQDGVVKTVNCEKVAQQNNVVK